MLRLVPCKTQSKWNRLWLTMRATRTTAHLRHFARFLAGSLIDDFAPEHRAKKNWADEIHAFLSLTPGPPGNNGAGRCAVCAKLYITQAVRRAGAELARELRYCLFAPGNRVLSFRASIAWLGPKPNGRYSCVKFSSHCLRLSYSPNPPWQCRSIPRQLLRSSPMVRS